MPLYSQICAWPVVFVLAGLATGGSRVQASGEAQMAPTATRPFQVVGYLPSYSLDRVSPDTHERLTDIIMFSAELTASGDFCDESTEALPISYFQQAKLGHGLRTYICFGGWGRSRGFPMMTGNAAKRESFIARLLAWCLANEFDGVDYDWEFPANADEHAAYARLLAETAASFRSRGLRVTVALGHTQTLDQAAYDAVDAIHLMTYDMGSRHATEKAAAAAALRLIRSGAAKEKIVLGVPFYGRRIDDRDVAMAYRDILEQFGPEPGTDEAGGFYFNNIETMRRKTRFSLEEGFAGIMIWELSMDVEGERSLLRAIQQEVVNTGP
jgi:chitinase